MEPFDAQDYESDFEPDSGVQDKRNKRRDLATEPHSKHVAVPQKQVFSEECSREQGRLRRFHDLSLDAYTRHKKLINEYVLCYRGATAKLRRNTKNDKTDSDVIRENHQFLWDEDEVTDTWEKRLARKYYDKLFKEYCLTDLSRYRENKVAMRWRTEQEVIDGKGQFFCGSIHCNEEDGLKSWEVNFGYTELGVKKNALVKLRLCSDCSDKLNFSRKFKEVTQKRKSSSDEDKLKKKKKNRHSSGDESTAEKSSHHSPKVAGNSEENVEQISDIDIWKQPIVDEVPKDDEFEDYLIDMLL